MINLKVSNASAKLDYPISLITADEAAMAGGVLSIPNSNYYLYNGQYFWTLSPSLTSVQTTLMRVLERPSFRQSVSWNYVTYSFGGPSSYQPKG